MEDNGNRPWRWDVCEEVLGSAEAATRLADGWEPLSIYVHEGDMGWFPDGTWGALNKYPMLVFRRRVPADNNAAEPREG